MKMALEDTIIQLKGMGKKFKTANGPVVALDDINLDIRRGEIFGIIGLSGAGKSTLVRCINMLEVPTSGEVLFEGQDLTSMSEAGRRKARQSMGMIFQQFNLLAQRNILKNICFPMEISGERRYSRTEARDRAMELLKLVGLEDRAGAYPAQLSGGQKQRVAIARAIATNPKVLLCDEATSALDPNTTKSILQLLKQINRDFGITVIVITHEMSVIESICDRVAIIDKSHIAEVGRVSDIFSEPKSKIGRQLILGDAVTNVAFDNSRKIRIIFDGRESMEPVIANMILASKVPVNILYASTRDVGGKAMGQMIIQLPEDADSAGRALHYLDTVKIPYEEVTGDDI
ncbi:MAG: ATP-binding cassette domain-containing protein [Eubacteriales bacterium]|nr:ATP-binding cassette domain-containing protein [Eubacteriales bacterium]